MHRRLAGVGGLAFAVLTVAGFVAAAPPGGSYSASHVATYLAKGHRISVLVAMHLALLAVFGLILLLAHLRDAIGDAAQSRVFWGTGLAGASSIAIGWAVIGGQVLAHLEGGTGVVIAPAVTHLVGQLGVTCIFGSGAIMLGFALIVLALGGRSLLPRWLRWLTLAGGVGGLGGLAFFPFFLFLTSVAVLGGWLLASTPRSPMFPERPGAM
jgi:hypothetical protein